MCEVFEAKPALQPSMSRAGNEAPEPCRSTAYAGVPATKPNASARVAIFANFEILNFFPFLGMCELQGKPKEMRLTIGLSDLNSAHP